MLRATGIRNVGGGSLSKEAGSRVTINLAEPLNSQVREIAASHHRQVAPMLREWIVDRVAQERGTRKRRKTK